MHYAQKYLVLVELLIYNSICIVPQKLCIHTLHTYIIFTCVCMYVLYVCAYLWSVVHEVLVH